MGLAPGVLALIAWDGINHARIDVEKLRNW